MRNILKINRYLFLLMAGFVMLCMPGTPAYAQEADGPDLCDPATEDCSEIEMDCEPPDEAYPLRLCSDDGKSAGDWMWNDEENYWMQCMAFEGHDDLWVSHEATAASLGSCECSETMGSCSWPPFEVSGGTPRLCMDFQHSTSHLWVDHSGELITSNCTPDTFGTSTAAPPHPYWPENVYCDGTDLIQLPTPPLTGSGSCSSLNAVQWAGGHPQICLDTDSDPGVTVLEWVSHTGSNVVPPPPPADCGMGTSFGYTPALPPHPYLPCNAYFDGLAWNALSAPGPYPDSPIDPNKQCFYESEIRYVDGQQAYCTGEDGGWEWMPMPEIIVECPIPPTDAEAIHAFDDEEHVQELTDSWDEVWKQPWQNMAQQFVVTMMHQVFFIGQLFDAQQQLETELLMQELTARTHKRYQPDSGICRLGTNVRGLLNSETLYRTNALLINRAMLSRETLSANRSSAWGPYDDLQNRLEQFKTTYCDLEENNANIVVICDAGAPPPARRNKDINFMRTVWDRYTLDIDFTDTILTEDEEDVLSLLSNIVSHHVFDQVPGEHLTQAYAKDELQDMRAIHAVRGITRNSFAHLIGMRAKGPPAGDHMFKFLEVLGVTSPDIELLFGENPSYFARMEILTRRIYQDPKFYSNLYTTPANVKRMNVALEAIKLMQDRDRYDAALRREMLVSLILEMNLREHQQAVTNDLLSSITVLFNSPPNIP